MSQQKSGAAVGATLEDSNSEHTVIEYLRSHPDFFERNPAALLGLKLPHRTNGSAVSLVERQVAMLRQRNGQLERQLKDLVAVAKTNDALVEKIHQLGLKLLRARGAAARLEVLDLGLREDFAAELPVLVLFDAAPAEARRDGFVKRLSESAEEVRAFAPSLRAGRPRCGPLRDRQKGVFDADAETIRSAALVPLGVSSSFGFLIIGSRDPDHFHPGQRVDFLVRLGESITVALGGEPLQRGA